MDVAALTFARRSLGKAARLPWRPVMVATILNCAAAAWAQAQTVETVEGYACTKGTDRRTIEIRYSEPGRLPCDVRYGGESGRRSKWASRNTPGLCESIANNIRGNLQSAGFQCEGLSGREQPAGTAEARPELNEGEMIQAADAALDRCVAKLRPMGAWCASRPFAFRIVGSARTPMDIGGTDVPVFLVEARYDPAAPGQARGVLYLVSQADRKSRRVVDESYGEFRAARSADLDDDGRTELMVFTSSSAGQGIGHVSFVVVGDARMLGYAVVQDVPVHDHEVYVLAPRTSGYRDLVALAGDSVVECLYRSGYQCRPLPPTDMGKGQ